MKTGAFLLACWLALASCEHRRPAPSSAATASSTPNADTANALAAASATATNNARSTNSGAPSIDEQVAKAFPSGYALPPYQGPSVERIIDRCAFLRGGEIRCFDGFELTDAQRGLLSPRAVGLFSNADQFGTGCLADAAGTTWCWGNVRAHAIAPADRCRWLPAPPQPEGEERNCPAVDGLYYCGYDARVCDVPVRLSRLAPVTQLHGARHYCGLTSAGSLYCWGENSAFEGPGPGRCRIPRGTDGQLGSEYCFDPVRVPKLPPVASFAVRSGRTCALTRDGKLWCWGALASNQQRTLVREEHGYGSAPTLQLKWPQLTQVVLGDGLLCALSSEGGVLCQVDEDGAPPRLLPGLGKVVQLASDGTTCARTVGGEVWCWFDFDLRHIAEPKLRRVPGLDHATQISATDGFACAVRADGAAYRWGTWPRDGKQETSPPVPLF